MEQYAPDKFFKAAAVADAVLIFHENRVIMIAGQEHIAMRILRPDCVPLGNAIKGQYNRIFYQKTVFILCRVCCQAQHHMRKTEQCCLDCIQQAGGPYRFAHTDTVARHTGDVLLRRIQKNFTIAVRLEQRVVS